MELNFSVSYFLILFDISKVQSRHDKHTSHLTFVHSQRTIIMKNLASYCNFLLQLKMPNLECQTISMTNAFSMSLLILSLPICIRVRVWGYVPTSAVSHFRHFLFQPFLHFLFLFENDNKKCVKPYYKNYVNPIAHHSGDDHELVKYSKSKNAN